MAAAGTRQATAQSVRDFDLLDNLTPIRRYKLILQVFLKRRGHGMGQSLAGALGCTPSFVTQLTSPAYDIPIPENQVRPIITAAGLSAQEESMFLKAYLEAHPDRAPEILDPEQSVNRNYRTVSIALPVLGSEVEQAAMEALVRRVVDDIAKSVVDMRRSNSDQAGGAARGGK